LVVEIIFIYIYCLTAISHWIGTIGVTKLTRAKHLTYLILCYKPTLAMLNNFFNHSEMTSKQISNLFILLPKVFFVYFTLCFLWQILACCCYSDVDALVWKLHREKIRRFQTLMLLFLLRNKFLEISNIFSLNGYCILIIIEKPDLYSRVQTTFQRTMASSWVHFCQHTMTNGPLCACVCMHCDCYGYLFLQMNVHWDL
jgi:hypothetical protein